MLHIKMHTRPPAALISSFIYIPIVSEKLLVSTYMTLTLCSRCESGETGASPEK
jgi:hypothetical protein